MNKEERMHRLMGDIDDDLVVDAARKPIRKAVWIPAVAAAACVALTVGLWQGGVFDPAAIPVEPSEGVAVTEPSEEAAVTEPSEKTEPSKTETTKTTTKTKPYTLISGEDNTSGFASEAIPSLKDRLVSPALEEKMKEYRDVNAVFQVAVSLAATIEDWDECNTFIETDEEYQSLLKQYKEAKTAEKKAGDRLHESRVNNEDSEIQAALLEEFRKVEKTANDLSHKLHILEQKLIEKIMASLEEERISCAAKYGKMEPISGCGYGYGYGIGYYDDHAGYYMELTADAINELADRGGYVFCLATIPNDTIGDMWCE